MRQKLPKDQVFTCNGMRGLASAGQRLQIHHQPGHLTAPLTSEGVSPPPALRLGLLRASHGAARRAVPATWPPLCLLPERNVGSAGLWLFALFSFYVFIYTEHLHVNAVVAEDGKMWGSPEVPGSSWEILYQGVEKKTRNFLLPCGAGQKHESKD